MLATMAFRIPDAKDVPPFAIFLNRADKRTKFCIVYNPKWLI